MKSADYLIGPAGQIDAILTLMAEDVKIDHTQNVKLLLYGPPGVGKTELVNRLAMRLTGDCPFGVGSVNGKELDLAKVKQWRESMRYGNIFSDFSVKIVNEIDRASNDAQVLMLTLLDELPARRAILCTSNLNLGSLADRFQTRFMQYKVAAPATEDIEFVCQQAYPGLYPFDYQSIAVGSGGNVRAALADAKAAHLTMRVDKAKKEQKKQDPIAEEGVLWD